MADKRPLTPLHRRVRFTIRATAVATIVVGLATVYQRSIHPAPVEMPEPLTPADLVTESSAAPHDETPPETELSPDQLELQQRLEAQFAVGRPTHRLVLTNGHVLDGQLMAATRAAVRFREAFGASGQIIASYPRTEVRSLTELAPEEFAVSLADVRLYQEFPTFKLAKFPPYTFISDEPLDTVEKVRNQLLNLRDKIAERFAPLIRSQTRPRNIQVVFFGQEAQFTQYVRRVAPNFHHSAGFYSAGLNRLAILNQFGSSHYAKLQNQFAREQRRLDQLPDASIADWGPSAKRLKTARRDADAIAEAITLRTINHEGAHQLFYAYGIHSRRDIEPTWLKEGLAEYCEPPELGGYHPGMALRVKELRNTGALLPLATLLNYHTTDGFLGLSRARSEAAYAESWAMVYFLMQPPTRPQFFAFIQRYRDVDDDATAEQLRTADVAQTLAASLGSDVSTLEARWQDFLRHL